MANGDCRDCKNYPGGLENLNDQGVCSEGWTVRLNWDSWKNEKVYVPVKDAEGQNVRKLNVCPAFAENLS